MENIVENYGLSIVALQIFDYLDDKSLSNARLVKKSWRNLIDPIFQERLSIRINELLNTTIREKKRFFEMNLEWIRIFQDFMKNRSLEDRRKLHKLMKEHFKQKYYETKDPLVIANRENSISKFELILPSVQNLRYKNYNIEVLPRIAMFASREIFELMSDIFEQKTGKSLPSIFDNHVRFFKWNELTEVK